MQTIQLPEELAQWLHGEADKACRTADQQAMYFLRSIQQRAVRSQQVRQYRKQQREALVKSGRFLPA